MLSKIADNKLKLIELKLIGLDVAWKLNRECWLASLESSPESGEIRILKFQNDSTLLSYLRPLAGAAAVGIDAPLSSPRRGAWRTAERELHKSGIPVLPLKKEFILKQFGGYRGVVLRRKLINIGILKSRIHELYPYACWWALFNRRPPKKEPYTYYKKLSALLKLPPFEALKRCWDAELPHVLDALLCAYTLQRYYSGAKLTHFGNILSL